MKKYFIAGALALALPVLSMAASFSNVSFENGDVTISGIGGSTVNATFHIIVPAGQVVEYVQTDVIGDSLAPVDTSVGGTLGLQEGTYDVSVPVKLPPNTGTYTLNVQGAGIFGGIRAINGNDNVVGTGSFGSALRVVAGNDSSTTIGGSSIEAITAAILARLNPPTPAPAPVSTACTEYAGLSAGLSVGSDTRQGGRVGQLQSFLMYKGFNIPLLSSNQAPYGYFGNQTSSASVAFVAANHCN